MSTYTLYNDDCLEVLKGMSDESIDSVVTDPPYGISFMGKGWDYDVPKVEIWSECLRVLKPGGHLLAFAGTRTQHRMAVRIEDAGFEIRDMIAWVYGSGFPKSLNVATAIGKLAEPKAEPKAEEVEFCQWLRENSTVEAVTATLGRRFWDCEVQIVNTATKDKPIMGRRALVPTAARWQQFKAAHSGQIPDRIEQLAKPEPIRAETPGEEWQPGKGNGTAGAGDWAGWGTALKPSIETVTWATKPFPPERERGRILANLWKIEARLWLLSSASAAAQSSTSSQSEYVAACATAQWTADDATSTRAALRGLMDTWQCEMATHMSLNIVSSWRRTLEESSKLGSTSIIETESSTTTDWKTLSCCLSEITPESIIQACSLPGGFNANASTAAQIFNASLALLQSTLTLSAIEPATWQELGARQGEDVRPSLDPVIMARKPLAGTVAANVLEHGTGALNVDGCRVAHGDDVDLSAVRRQQAEGTGIAVGKGFVGAIRGKEIPMYKPGGRWPANLIHDGSDEVMGLFPQTAQSQPFTGSGATRNVLSSSGCEYTGTGYSDSGSAARFFYVPKASRSDRGEGNDHPTVKPTDLMAYLCRLVTPPGGVVLDPFMGSGSTGKAAMLEGFKFIGIEREVSHFSIAESRIEEAANRPQQTLLF